MKPGKGNKLLSVARQLAAITFARVVPFSLWVVIFPMKKCSDYFLGDSDELIVNYLGCTDRLSYDLLEILKDAGIRTTGLYVPHTNRSNHGMSSRYVRSAWIRRLIERRYRRDIQLFLLVKDGYFRRTNSGHTVR